MLKTLRLSLFLFFSLASYGQSAINQEINPQNINSLIDSINSQTSDGNFTPPEKREFGEESLQEFTSCEPGDTLCIDPASKNLASTANIFGFDYIRTSPTSIDASSDLPVPNDYKITFKDQIKIIMSGTKKTIFTLTVGLDGSILFPEIGSIQVVGDTYLELKKKLQNLIEISYVGVNIDISLDSLSAKKINILGAVQRPGTFLVNPFTTLSNALAYSGGLTRYSSLRTINLIRGDVVYEFDLYDFLLNGDRSNDVNIEAGDTILVKTTNNFTSVSGEVKNPSIYEYKDGETIQDIIRYASGLTQTANENKIGLLIRSKDNRALYTEEIQLDENYKVTDVEKIEVFGLRLDVESEILVLGAISEEGYYQAEDNMIDLIKKIQLVDDTYPYIALVQTPVGSYLFSLKDESTQKVPIIKNSMVKFFSSAAIKNKQSIYGDLNKDSIDLLNDYSLKIDYSFGQTSVPIFGQYNTADIFKFLNIDMDRYDTKQTTFSSPLSDTVIIDDYTNKDLKNSKFDSISLRLKNSELISVSVTGQVKFPGQYRLPSTSTLADLYKAAGGLKKSADKKHASFTRASVRDAQLRALNRAKDELREFLLINKQTGQAGLDPSLVSLLSNEIPGEYLGRISGNFSFGSDNADSFFLQNGDSLFVPTELNTVSVYGEVLNPSTILFSDDFNYKKYLEAAGGLKQYALSKDIYVIKANGLVKKRPRFLLFRGNIDIEPGDTIIVPRDLKVYENDVARVLLPISTVISNLAFGAASLEALRNN